MQWYTKRVNNKFFKNYALSYGADGDFYIIPKIEIRLSRHILRKNHRRQKNFAIYFLFWHIAFLTM